MAKRRASADRCDHCRGATAQRRRPPLILRKSLGSRPEPRARSGSASSRQQPISNPEAYRLRVTAKGATITASDPKGLFYGAQTLRQLVIDDARPRAIAAATSPTPRASPGAAC